MSKLIIDLEEKLKKLKSSTNLLAIKAEFEAEGTRIEELSIISFLCSKYSIPLTLKIGGTCAKRDIFEAFQVGANNILVPMVESDFSLEYFINCYESFKSNFESFNNCPSISINIESIKGFENLDLILQQIKTNHSDIADDFCNGKGIGLLNLDSQITEYVIEKFVSSDIPILCIHDSFIVSVKQDNFLRKTMVEAIQKIINNANPKIKRAGFGYSEIHSNRHLDRDFYLDRMIQISNKCPN